MADSKPMYRKEWLVFSGKKTDFPIWQERFLARMRKQKLHLVLLGRYPLPTVPSIPEASASTADKDAYDKAVVARQEADEKLLDLQDSIYCELVEYLDAESLMFIRHDAKLPDGSGNGTKAWKLLCQRFASTDKPAVMSITAQLTNLRLSNDEKISGYLLRTQELVSQLVGAGENMSDSLINSFILQGLPNDFESFITMEGFHPSTSVMDLRHRLQMYSDTREEKMKQENSVSSSVSYFSQANKTVTCFRCGKPGHKKSDCRSSNAAGSGIGKGSASLNSPRCGNCNKKGHTRESCWGKGGGAEGKGPKGGKTDSNALSCTYHAMACESNVRAFSVDSNRAFVIDSGCTDHMLNSKEFFTDYQPCVNGRVVRSANQSTSSIAGSGTARIAVKDDSGCIQTLVLTDALHVPDHGRNLLSVKSAIHKGNTVQLSNDKSCIRLKDGTVIPLHIENNLFVITSEEDSEQCLTAATDDEQLTLWHRRLGHVNVQDLVPILQSSADVSSGSLGGKKIQFCEPCALGKLSRVPVPQQTDTRAATVRERVFSDVAGPFRASIGGAKYIVSFIDDFSRYVVFKFMTKKSEVLSCFQEYVSEYGAPKALRSDNGGEYVSGALEEFCRSQSIRREFTVPETPEQNGVAERFFRTSVEMGRCLLLEANLPSTFWVRAIDTAVYIRNRCCSRSLPKGITPYQAFHGTAPKINHMRVFGCTAYALKRKNKTLSKLEAKSDKTKFVGYDYRSKAYLVYNFVSGKIEKTRNVRFNEADLNFAEVSEELDQDFCDESLDPAREEAVDKPVCETAGEECRRDTEDTEVPVQPDQTNQVTDIANEQAPIVRERRQTRPPQRFDEYLLYNPDEDLIETFNVQIEDENPLTYKQAISSEHASSWKIAMDDEFQALTDNCTWDLVPAPPGRKIIGGKWVYKVKHGANGEIEKYKARYVAKGFNQIPGLDFTETYAPTARPETIRLIFALSAQYDCLLHQLDVKSAYLHSEIDEEVYIEQPIGYEQKASDGSKLVCKLLKSIYGLKQAAFNWNRNLSKFLAEQNFKRSEHDNCLYFRQCGESFDYIVIWVDDIIIASTNSESVADIKRAFNGVFKMEDKGALQWFLGMEVRRESGITKVNQSQYIKTLLEKFGMSDCKSAPTPGAEKEILTKSDCPESGSQESIQMRNCDYRGFIGGLLYISVYTRPDISFSVCTLSMFLDNPGVVHWTAAKRVLRYLKGTLNCSLTYRKDVNGVVLAGASDADWASSVDDRRSTSGYCFTIQTNSSPISWKSQKQPIVALSSTESEYIALALAGQEAVFLRNLLSEIGFNQSIPTVLSEDNQSCIALTKNPGNHKRTKHIDVKYHFLRNLTNNGVISVIYISTEIMIADILTKHLGRLKTDRFRDQLVLQV